MRLFTCVAVTYATKLLLVDNTNEVPSKAKLYSVDTEAQTATVVSSELDGSLEWLSGAAVCGNKYYSVNTDVPRFGLGVVDLTTGEASSLNTQGLWHAIWCGPFNNTLLAVQSSPTPPFSVVTFDLATFNTTTINTFPTGDLSGATDTVFSYNKAANEVWAAFPGANIPIKNNLAVISVSSGELSNYPYKWNSHFSYAVFPTGKAAGEGVSFTGLMSGGETPIDGELVYSTHTIDGGEVTSKLGANAEDMFTSSEPFHVCDGTVYGVTPHRMLVSFDPITLKPNAPINLNNLMDFTESGYPAGLACA